MIPLSSTIIERYLSDCFAAEQAPRVSEFAQCCGISPAQLTRRFVREHGMRPGEYIKRRQVEVAQQLLDSTTLSTTEIAYCAGFGTRRTFFRVFRRITGMTPAQFRNPRRPEAA